MHELYLWSKMVQKQLSLYFISVKLKPGQFLKFDLSIVDQLKWILKMVW